MRQNIKNLRKRSFHIDFSFFNHIKFIDFGTLVFDLFKIVFLNKNRQKGKNREKLWSDCYEILTQYWDYMYLYYVKISTLPHPPPGQVTPPSPMKDTQTLNHSSIP